MAEFASKDIEILAFKLDQVHERQSETSEKVSDIRERVLNPETGLYPKVAKATTQVETALGKINGVKKDIDKMVEAWSGTKERILLVESWAEDHEERNKVFQDHLSKIVKSVEPIADDYKIRMSRKKWTDKILWLLMSLALAAAVKTFFFA